jgi:hypothetical protein
MHFEDREIFILTLTVLYGSPNGCMLSGYRVKLALFSDASETAVTSDPSQLHHIFGRNA